MNKADQIQIYEGYRRIIKAVYHNAHVAWGDGKFWIGIPKIIDLEIDADDMVATIHRLVGEMLSNKEHFERKFSYTVAEDE